MYFEEKDIELCIDGMGIVFFSPKTTKDIPEGIDFFNQEYSAPADVSAHLKKGDVVGFCTGSGGDFILKFREGYPDDRINNEYSVSARLGIEIKDDKLCIGYCKDYNIDTSVLMEKSISILMDKKEKLKQIREKNDAEFYLQVVPTLCVDESTPALAPSMTVMDFCYETM